MQAAHMTFKEETFRLRGETKLLRQLHARDANSNSLLRQKVIHLERINQEQGKEITALKKKLDNALLINRQQGKKLEDFQLIIEELRRMIFRTSKKAEKDETKIASDTDQLQTKKRKKANRTNESYRREAPSEDEVTNVFEHTLTHCPDCGTLLTAVKKIIRYIEDLQDLTQLAMLLKRVEKHIITTGFCQNCKKRKTAKTISPQVSTLGEETKKFITYLIIIMRLSFEQVRCFLNDTSGLSVSDGEIVASLDQYADKLIPEKKRILRRIRGAPGRHYDETTWKVQHGLRGNYCWASTPTIGEDTVFLMGRSRGKGVAEELRGEEDNQVGITDDYAAYDNTFKKHQLCMSHPKRKLRDLHETKTLVGIRKASCTDSYTAFSQLYAELEETLKTPYEEERWLQKREEYLKRLHAIAVVTPEDPDKLKRIKLTLDEKTELYFTCLLEPGIPADNNKEERKIRHIVLKRKSSQGSKSDKGADTMGVLCTTLLSAWWKKPENFFVAYNQLLED